MEIVATFQPPVHYWFSPEAFARSAALKQANQYWFLTRQEWPRYDPRWSIRGVCRGKLQQRWWGDR